MKKLLGTFLLLSCLKLSAYEGQWCCNECNSCGCLQVSGLRVSGEYLLWYAKENSLPYALETKTVPTFQGETNPFNFPTNYQVVPQNGKTLEESWDSGFRVGLAFEGNCGNWDLSAYYTSFRTKESTSVCVPFTVAAIPTGSQNPPTFIPTGKSLVSPWINSTASVLNLSDANPNTPQFFQKIWAKWKLKYYIGDLEFGKTLCFTECFSNRFFIGARGGWTEIDFVTRPSRNYPFDNIQIEENYQVKFRNRFYGYGLLGGFQPFWNLSGCWGIYGNASFSLLWGRYSEKRTEDYFGLSRIRDAEFSFDFDLGRYKDRFHCLQPILDLGAGFRWSSYFGGDCFCLNIDVGWEHHIWFDHVYRLQLTGLGGEVGTTARLSTFSNFSEVTSNLTLAGLIVRARLEF
jgi:hypothetical protein